MTIVMTDYDRTLERAKRLASVAHQGQKDSGGAPYINHPMRVATYVQITSAWCGLSAEEQQVATIAAWLHDVIEDTRHKAVSITADSLLSRGFAQEVVEVVVLLTRVKGVPDEVYYQRILENRIARAAKWADMIDNTDPSRTSRLSESRRERLAQKYYEGAACLKISPKPQEWWKYQMASAPA